MKTMFFNPFPFSKIFRIIIIYAIVNPAFVSLSYEKLNRYTNRPVEIDGSGRSYDPTIYFVSTSGHDDNDGRSEESAFRTVTRAFRAVAPGGTIRILPGSYYAGVHPANFGSADATITIAGFKGVPTLNGRGKIPIGLFLEKCSRVVIRNLKIKNYTDIGIGAAQCDRITLEKLIVLENGHSVQLSDWEIEGYGIHVEDSRNVEIINNDVFRNGPNPQIFPDYLMGTGIDTFHNQTVLIRGNRSHDNIGGGILVEDSVSVVVEKNNVYRNDLDASSDEWWDGGIWLDGGRNVIIRNNIFKDNLGPGIEISDEDLQHPTGYVLENNLSGGNYYGIFIWNFGTTDWPVSSILQRRNNQIAGNRRKNVWIEAWICSDDQLCD